MIRGVVEEGLWFSEYLGVENRVRFFVEGFFFYGLGIETVFW